MKTKAFFILVTLPAALIAQPTGPAPESATPTTFVTEATATLSHETEVYRYTGRIVAISTVNITSRISADLKKVGFEEGDKIKAGQLLYEFDDTRYAAALKSAQSKIAEYEAKLIYAKNDYNRTNELFEKGVSTKDEMESALSQYKS